MPRDRYTRSIGKRSIGQELYCREDDQAQSRRDQVGKTKTNKVKEDCIVTNDNATNLLMQYWTCIYTDITNTCTLDCYTWLRHPGIPDKMRTPKGTIQIPSSSTFLVFQVVLEVEV